MAKLSLRGMDLLHAAYGILVTDHPSSFAGENSKARTAWWKHPQVSLAHTPGGQNCPLVRWGDLLPAPVAGVLGAFCA